MAETQVTINPDTEAVYSKAQIEELIKRMETAEAQMLEYKQRERMIYNNVKRVHAMIPFQGGRIDFTKLPGLINRLGSDKGIMDAFSGLGDFVTQFEKANLVVVK